MPTADAPTRLLLVEGEDDYHVVMHLRNRHLPALDFSVTDMKGDGKLLDAISREVRVSGRVGLGIMLDADDDVDARWGQVRERLEPLMAAEGSFPDTPDPNGTIIEVHPHRLFPSVPVGVWLMPDNASPGELEDFVRRMIPSADGVWPRAESYVDGIPQAERRFREGKALRATLYAWLAAREQPGRMGAAIGAGDLDTDIDLATRFTGWLRALFR